MRFFVLQNPKADDTSAVTDFLPVDGSPTAEAPGCPVCGKFVAMMPLRPPVRVELEMWGTQLGDIAFGPANELLVTERFWGLYQASGLIGLRDVGPAEVVSVRAYRKQKRPAPPYHCCRVTQGSAAIDDTESGVEREESETCEACRQGGILKRAKRVILEPDSWSGEDIFFARGLPGTILVSEKFQKFCEENEISNCLLVSAEEFSFDHYPWE